MDGNGMRRRREALGWSRVKLAAEAGVAVNTVVGFEEGRRTPRPATLVVLKQALERAEPSLPEEDAK